jgi:hypothetical protein
LDNEIAEDKTMKIGNYEIAPGADLREANLRGVNLYGANMHGANLYRANLCEADLRVANLYNANLYGADLRGADLCKADLYGANLYGADLREANLRGVNLREAKNIPDYVASTTTICPEGDVIGWKQLAGNELAKLLIPAAAKRSNATGRKCRAEYAVVLEGNGVSLHDNDFIYRAGETVRPKEPFCEDRWEECASGIHFYLTKWEAENG